jgi:autotransporter family porin
MGSGKTSRAGRRAWLSGRVGILVAISVVGAVAIVHYSSLGNVLAASPRHAAASARPRAVAAVRANRPGAVPAPAPTPGVPPAHGAPAHFRTVPPGAKLPAGGECARWVLARPKPENKGVNRRFNRRE